MNSFDNYTKDSWFGMDMPQEEVPAIPGYTKDSWFGRDIPEAPTAPNEWSDYFGNNLDSIDDTLYDPYATSETLPWQAEQAQAAMMYPETAGDQSWMNEYPLDNMSYLIPAGGLAGMSRIKSGSASKMATRGGSGQVTGNAYAGLTQAQAAKQATLNRWKEQQLKNASKIRRMQAPLGIDPRTAIINQFRAAGMPNGELNSYLLSQGLKGIY